LKLGASLASRDLAPHVFETKAEAQARNTAQSVPLKPRPGLSQPDRSQPPNEPLDA
jgi:propionate CoA-transferase